MTTNTRSRPCRKVIRTVYSVDISIFRRLITIKLINWLSFPLLWCPRLPTLTSIHSSSCPWLSQISVSTACFITFLQYSSTLHNCPHRLSTRLFGQILDSPFEGLHSNKIARIRSLQVVLNSWLALCHVLQVFCLILPSFEWKEDSSRKCCSKLVPPSGIPLTVDILCTEFQGNPSSVLFYYEHLHICFLFPPQNRSLVCSNLSWSIPCFLSIFASEPRIPCQDWERSSFLNRVEGRREDHWRFYWKNEQSFWFSSSQTLHLYWEKPLIS